MARKVIRHSECKAPQWVSGASFGLRFESRLTICGTEDEDREASTATAAGAAQAIDSRRNWTAETAGSSALRTGAAASSAIRGRTP